MPKVTMKLNHRPTFEYDIPQEKIDQMTPEELKQELTTVSDIELADGAPEYDDDDWTLDID